MMVAREACAFLKEEGKRRRGREEKKRHEKVCSEKEREKERNTKKVLSASCSGQRGEGEGGEEGEKRASLSLSPLLPVVFKVKYLWVCCRPLFFIAFFPPASSIDFG